MDAICLSGGCSAFFSFPAPCMVAPSAWQKQAWIMQTHALHDQSIKYLSPSKSSMWLWNVMAHPSGGGLPPCLPYQHAESFTTPPAPTRCHKDLLHCLANSALWLNQDISCSFYRHGFIREISANLLLSLLGRFCSYCWSPGCWGCTGALLPQQDQDVCMRCRDSSWKPCWPTVSPLKVKGIFTQRSSTSLS